MSKHDKPENKVDPELTSKQVESLVGRPLADSGKASETIEGEAHDAAMPFNSALGITPRSHRANHAALAKLVKNYPEAAEIAIGKENSLIEDLQKNKEPSSLVALETRTRDNIQEAVAARDAVAAATGVKVKQTGAIAKAKTGLSGPGSP
jgi:hypothetical protein